MMRVASALCAMALIASVVSALPERELTEVEYESMWQGYIGEFSKVYHPTEVMTRYNIFKVFSPRFIASRPLWNRLSHL